MKSHTVYRTFNTEGRREFIRITEDVQAAVDAAGVSEGLALVAAMHITAGVWVNDDEPGLHEDTLEWLDKVAPPSWKPPANAVAGELLPAARLLDWLEVRLRKLWQFIERIWRASVAGKVAVVVVAVILAAAVIYTAYWLLF